MQILSLLFLLWIQNSHASVFVSAEGAIAWQSKNEQRVPGEGGTLFNLSKIENGPFQTGRLYVGYRWSDKHELRALYAPFKVSFDGQLPYAARFDDQDFAANVETRFTYKFNSYRLTYAYHFLNSSRWNLAAGFTGKIRDAEVAVRQGSLSAKKSNVGFVPLLNFQALLRLSENWNLRTDIDALAAPQGRAVDLGLFIERQLGQSLQAFTGYRMVEGGADNKKVYNFAWIHFATLGLTAEF